jgi:hypothetical protein
VSPKVKVYPLVLIILKGDLDQVLREKDVTKRAELLIEAAKRVIGDKEACFVTPKDIVSVETKIDKIYCGRAILGSIWPLQ